MNNERSTRKDVIKNIAIVFLAVLLVLTLFSNTFMNYTLPQVSAVYVSNGTISEQIRGSGTIEPAEKYEVKFEQTREIKSVPVKAGQTVAAGDTLFELADTESKELEEAEKTLATLELEYQKQLISLSSDSKYAQDYTAIASEEAELKKLREQLAQAENGTDVLTAASNKYKKAKSDYDAAVKKKENLTAQLASVDTEDMLELSGDYYKRLRAAKDAVSDAEKDAEDAQKEYDDLVKELGTVSDYKDEITAKRNEIDTARAELNQLYIELYNASPEDDTTAISASIAAKTTQITNLERELNNLLTKSSSSGVARAKLKAGQDKLESAQKKVTNTKDKLSDEIRSIKLALKGQINKADSEVTSANIRMTDAESEKTDAEASGALTAAQLKIKVEEKEDSVSKLKLDLATKKETDSVESEKAQLDIDAKAKEIEKQKEKIEKLKGENVDTVIKAKIGGVIESLSVTAGSTAEAGSVAAVINVSDKGYILEFAVKNDQAKKLKTGDKAEITSWYWGGDMSAVLSEIRTDTANPQTQKILSFIVTGSDITTGQTLTLSMGSKGQPYSTVVPNSAIREDSNGKFILAMESKNSPLGNRYKAVRYDVEVLAKDDNNSAVSGLMGSEFVITTSTEPINAGTQVRPAD